MANGIWVDILFIQKSMIESGQEQLPVDEHTMTEATLTAFANHLRALAAGIAVESPSLSTWLVNRFAYIANDDVGVHGQMMTLGMRARFIAEIAPLLIERLVNPLRQTTLNEVTRFLATMEIPFVFHQ